MNTSRKSFFILAAFAVFLMFPSSQDYADGQGIFPHQNPGLLPEQCGSCHKSHGRSGTALLPEEEENNCYRCHGNRMDFLTAGQTRKVAVNARHIDLSNVFKKPYRHPVEIQGAHNPREQMPERDTSAPRHSECVDCHDAHYAFRVPPLALKGISHRRSSLKEVNLEYELCYRCHSNSVNRPFGSADIQLLMSPGNASYHPVEAPSSVISPSLLQPYKPGSIINCTDCHGNDDPQGPKGPHGSNYEGLLRLPYVLTDGNVESEAAYGLCYECHSRSSINGDESFTFHRKHIQDGRVSCFGCHDPHGSERNPALIRFDTSLIDPLITPVQASSSGMLGFFSKGRGAGECFLTCHGVDHNPMVYP